MSTIRRQNDFQLWSFHGPMKILHLSWLAFFISFVVWFNFAPLMAAIRETFQLTDQQVKLLLILNVALTIPARILIGMLVDKHGPRITFSVLLALGSAICFLFAFADSFEKLAIYRFLLGFVGAGFVIGIRLVSEWFPARQVGMAEGIYGGWGNFGSAFAAMTLPALAAWIGGADGWRYAVAATGAVALVYSFVFYAMVRNNPKGTTYYRPKNLGAMEVSSKKDFALYCFMSAPLYMALGVLAWKVGPANLGILSGLEVTVINGGLLILYAYQVMQIYRVNRGLFTPAAAPVPEIHRYPFKQVAVLDLAYMVTFGSELAVVSMLPLYFFDTFKASAHLTMTQAGLIASVFAGMNLIMRPAGGWLSDRFGRKRTLAATLIGAAVGYAGLAQMDATWSVSAAVAVVVFTSLFVNAGNGAVYALVPLIKRRLTGQIAGMAGAFGNVGGVAFLTVLSFVTASKFFLVIGGAAALAWIVVIWALDEPRGYMYEQNDDGSIEKISLDGH